MKTLSLTIFLMLMSCAAHGQDITGQWSGALNVQGTQLRLVFHVSKNDNQYEATMDSPDQNVSGIKVTTVTFGHPNVKFEIFNLGVMYEGTLSDKGITGTWMQSGTSLLLNLVKGEDSPKKREPNEN